MIFVNKLIQINRGPTRAVIADRNGF